MGVQGDILDFKHKLEQEFMHKDEFTVDEVMGTIDRVYKQMVGLGSHFLNEEV